MAYLEERGSFVEMMRNEGVSEALARLILRHANTIRRTNLVEVNGMSSEQDTASRARATKALAGVAKESAVAISFELSGEPSITAVKVVLPSGRTNDAEKLGWNVPTRAF